MLGSDVSPLTIDADTRVSLYFSVALEDGAIVDSNFDKSPATFVMGDGNFLPGFEKALLGLKAGDKRSIYMPPSKAFGEMNSDNIKVLQRNSFVGDLELEEGLLVSFETGDGELPGLVTKLRDDWVEVDFNHPLAGRELTFQVHIISVEPCGAEQLVNLLGELSADSKALNSTELTPEVLNSNELSGQSDEG